MKICHGIRGTLVALVTLMLAACQVRLPVNVATPEATLQPSDTATVQSTQTPVVIVVTATPPVMPTEQASSVVQITPRSISGTLMLQTAKTVLAASLDGRDKANKSMAGDLTIEKLTTDSLKQTSTVLKGSLINRTLDYLTKDHHSDEFAQSAVYRIMGGSYWMVQYATDSSTNCIKIVYPDQQDPFYRDQTPFEDLLMRRQPFMYGKPLGEEVVNGIKVRHYALDPDASNRAAQASSDQQVHESAAALKLVSGDIFLASEGDYLVRYNAEYVGEVKEFDFNGRVQLNYDFSRPTDVPEVKLPAECVAAEERSKLPPTVGKAELLTFYPYYGQAKAGILKSALGVTVRGRSLTGRAMSGGVSTQYIEDQANQRQLINLEGLAAPQLASAPELEKVAARRISLYMFESGDYLLAEGWNARNTRCASLTADDRDKAADLMMPDSIMNIFIDMGTLYGTALRDEMVNGVLTRHYKLDVAATNVAAAKSRNKEYILPELTKGDVYIARDGDYLVRLTAEATGVVQAMKFNGRTTVRFDFTTPARGTKIELPQICKNTQPS